MKLSELKLRNLTVFQSADFHFASGINVLIGENATGKSHALKVIYALLKASRNRSAKPEEEIKSRLAAIFRPDDKDVGRLVRVGADGPCTLWLKANGNETLASLSEHADVTLTVNRWSDAPRALYLPARDVLAMYEGFVTLYDRAELSFDETYYDVCVALQGPSRRGEAKSSADELASSLLVLLGGEVDLQGSRFYVDLGDGPREAHLVAEGLRKIATLAHLVSNGSIEAGSVLLWDEPETNLNPRLLTKLAEALRMLASRGVQIFVATHDFLLAHRLSLAAEYDLEPKVEQRFFSLHHESPTEPVEVEAAQLVTSIQNNPILEAYASYYEDQRELFHRELERRTGAAP